MKIVYCINSISLLGGVEKVTLVKANALSKIPGNEVWIVVTDGQGDPLIPLEGVHVVNLDVRYYDKNVGFLEFFRKKSQHKKRLKECLNSIMPDVVISTGRDEKSFLPSLQLNSKPVVVRELHLPKHFRLIMAENWKKKMLARGREIYDYHWKIKGYDCIVLLTEEDRQKNWRGWDKVSVIPNPITSTCEKKSNRTAHTAISVGRLSEQKDFPALIRMWKKVVEQYPDWQLEIWGKGEMENALQQQIEELKMEDKVLLKGFTPEPIQKMSQASMYLLSSKYEGLPLVIVEAMSVGLPVVSYMCPTGPKDIIDDGHTGFLIPNGDEDAFVEKVCKLIADEELRQKMGQEALKASENYRIERIAQRWMELFQQLLDRKRKTN